MEKSAYLLTFQLTQTLIITDADIGKVASNNRAAEKIEKLPVRLILVDPDLPY